MAHHREMAGAARIEAERDAALALAAQWATRRLAAQRAIHSWSMQADTLRSAVRDLRAELDVYHAHHERCCAVGCELRREVGP